MNSPTAMQITIYLLSVLGCISVYLFFLIRQDKKKENSELNGPTDYLAKSLAELNSCKQKHKESHHK